MVDSNSNFIQRHHKGNRGGDGRGAHSHFESKQEDHGELQVLGVAHCDTRGAPPEVKRAIGHSSLSIKAFWLYAATLWRTSLKRSAS